MHLTLAAGAIGLLTALARAETRVSFYTAKDCSSGYITTATGDGSDINSLGVEFTINQYVGGIAIDHFDQFSAQLNDQDGCVFTTITCCEYAPTCKVPAPVSDADGYCVEYDKVSNSGGV